MVKEDEQYRQRTGERAPEFRVFTLWFMCQAPEVFQIPEEWKSFADDAKELHSKGDRQGFFDVFMTHLSDLNDKGAL